MALATVVGVLVEVPVMLSVVWIVNGSKNWYSRGTVVRPVAVKKENGPLTITIYHNPACGTSRNTLAMIRQSGEEPLVIEYLKNPPSRARLAELIKAMGIPARALLREKGTPYAELGLADPKWTEDELLDFMMAHPRSGKRGDQSRSNVPKRPMVCRLPSGNVMAISRFSHRIRGRLLGGDS